MPQALGFAILGFVGVTGATALAATIVGTVVLAGVSLGVSYIAAQLSKVPPPHSTPSADQQEIRESLAFRRKSYGVVRLAGAVFWYARAAASPRNLFYGWAINHGRIGSILSYLIDDNEVTLDGSFLVTAPVTYSGANIYLRSRLGLPTETPYAELETYFGTAEARGDGVATVLGQFYRQDDPTDQSSVYPNGLPKVRVTIDGSVCFDPRESAHDVADESTWEVTENPIVAVLDYMKSPDGFGVDYARRILPNLAEWIAAMEICDEDVDLAAGGTGKRYRIAATFDFGERPVDVLARMLAICDGRVWNRRDGTLGVAVGRFVAPTVTLVNRDITGYDLTHGQDRLTAVAGLRGTYMEPTNDYKEQEAEPWPTGAAVLALSEDKVDSLNLNFCPAHHQARRLLKREYIRRTAAWAGTITTNLAGLRAIDERFINIQIEEAGAMMVDESFEVIKWSLDFTNMRCSLEVRSVGPEIDDWDTEAEEGNPNLVIDFGYLSSFSKTGTTLDPIVEGGGKAGDGVLVFVATTGGAIAATPAGWSLIRSVGPISGLAFAAFAHTLDGGEGSTAFLDASGAIVQVNLQKAFPADWTDSYEIATGLPAQQLIDHAAPTSYFLFAAGSTENTDPLAEWAYFGKSFAAGVQIQDHTIVNAVPGGPTIALKFALYRAAETSDGECFANILGDQGTNALMTIAISPRL